MKDKKTLYLLIPLVIVIWGYVGYKFFTFGTEELTVEPIRIGDILEKERLVKERSKLLLDYKDPFLKNIRNGAVKPAVQRVSQPKPAAPNINWGQVIYSGFINNSEKGKKIALLKMDGKSILGEKGRAYGEVEIKRIESDSILLQKQGVSQWFVKPKNLKK